MLLSLRGAAALSNNSELQYSMPKLVKDNGCITNCSEATQSPAKTQHYVFSTCLIYGYKVLVLHTTIATEQQFEWYPSMEKLEQPPVATVSRHRLRHHRLMTDHSPASQKLLVISQPGQIYQPRTRMGQ
jgi:hypothetical protein